MASIAIPALSAARASANEASAIGSARTASSAQTAYVVLLRRTAPTRRRRIQLSIGGFVGPDFVQPVKHGFAFTSASATSAFSARSTATGTRR